MGPPCRISRQATADGTARQRWPAATVLRFGVRAHRVRGPDRGQPDSGFSAARRGTVNIQPRRKRRGCRAPRYGADVPVLGWVFLGFLAFLGVWAAHTGWQGRRDAWIGLHGTLRVLFPMLFGAYLALMIYSPRFMSRPRFNIGAAGSPEAASNSGYTSLQFLGIVALSALGMAWAILGAPDVSVGCVTAFFTVVGVGRGRRG